MPDIQLGAVVRKIIKYISILKATNKQVVSDS